MSEATEQAALIEWAAVCAGQEPRLALLFHVPNGGARPAFVSAKGKRYSPEAQRLAAQGVKAGVPDLWLPVAAQGAHALIIEMKARGGSVSDAQQWWIDRLCAQGYHTRVCWDWTEAARVICWYLDRADLPLPALEVRG